MRLIIALGRGPGGRGATKVTRSRRRGPGQARTHPPKAQVTKGHHVQFGARSLPCGDRFGGKQIYYSSADIPLHHGSALIEVFHTEH